MTNTFRSKSFSFQAFSGRLLAPRALLLVVVFGLAIFAQGTHAHPEHQDKPLSSQFPLPSQPGPLAPGL